ncbi:spermidine synthase [Microbacterium halophytorum]|uniref:spermidine synthase n=1 Tax=Microbacterium halophytorum TaxID=2067568 RepID=UPI000CFD9814|nr:fused MFS/spermidine synthase [Microbacterium halophytorum]
MDDIDEGQAGRTRSITLSSGTEAQLVPRDGGWSLEIDGVRQSQIVAPGRPPALATTRWALAAIGDGEPLRCAHLGGAILTLPRVLAERRPGSPQLAVELEPAFVELCRTELPVPDGIEIIEGDAREWIDMTAPDSWDVVTCDVFAGGRIPPAFTSREFFASAHRVLRAHGLFVCDSVAGPEPEFTRRELATLRDVFRHVAVITPPSVLAGLRFGNAMLIASDAPIDAERIRAALRDEPSKGRLVTDLDEFVGDATIIRDADEVWSPVPRLPNLRAAREALDAIEAMKNRVKGVTA